MTSSCKCPGIVCLSSLFVRRIRSFDVCNCSFVVSFVWRVQLFACRPCSFVRRIRSFDVCNCSFVASFVWRIQSLACHTRLFDVHNCSLVSLVRYTDILAANLPSYVPEDARSFSLKWILMEEMLLDRLSGAKCNKLADIRDPINPPLTWACRRIRVTGVLKELTRRGLRVTETTSDTILCRFPPSSFSSLFELQVRS